MTTDENASLKSGYSVVRDMVVSLAIATPLRVESKDGYILCSRDMEKSTKAMGI